MWGRFRIAVLRRDLGNFPPRGKPPRSHPNELRQKPVEAVSWLILRASEQAQLGWNLKYQKIEGETIYFPRAAPREISGSCQMLFRCKPTNVTSSLCSS